MLRNAFPVVTVLIGIAVSAQAADEPDGRQRLKELVAKKEAEKAAAEREAKSTSDAIASAEKSLNEIQRQANETARQKEELAKWAKSANDHIRKKNDQFVTAKEYIASESQEVNRMANRVENEEQAIERERRNLDNRNPRAVQQFNDRVRAWNKLLAETKLRIAHLDEVETLHRKQVEDFRAQWDQGRQRLL
jgi:chromosome segregation ATPase